jgi:hypothetical protein
MCGRAVMRRCQRLNDEPQSSPRQKSRISHGTPRPAKFNSLAGAGILVRNVRNWVETGHRAGRLVSVLVCVVRVRGGGCCVDDDQPVVGAGCRNARCAPPSVALAALLGPEASAEAVAALGSHRWTRTLE